LKLPIFFDCKKTKSKVTKKYDETKTPYGRVSWCIDIDDGKKRKLKLVYDKLNPAELKRMISRLQDKLLKLNSLKKTLERNNTIDEKPKEYIYQ